MPAYITGSGSFLPARTVSNHEIAPTLGLDPAQIQKSSGILSRHWADKGTTTSSLAAEALNAAIADAGVAKEGIDYLILGTMTPDRFIPGSAPAVQKSVGLREIPCLDIRAACCNALYALHLAKALIESGAASNVAICLAEIQSAWLDMSPASGTTSMLFGDGASALVVSSEQRTLSLEIVDIVLGTDGSYVDDLGIRCPGTEFGNTNTGDPTVEEIDYLPRMVGQSVILQASRKMVAVCNEALKRNGLDVNSVRWIVPHQANANLLQQVARALKFPADSDGLISVLADSGNTSSASMGIALDSLRRSERVQSGDYLLLPAFAAGFTWGAGICRAVQPS